MRLAASRAWVLWRCGRVSRPSSRAALRCRVLSVASRPPPEAEPLGCRKTVWKRAPQRRGCGARCRRRGSTRLALGALHTDVSTSTVGSRSGTSQAVSGAAEGTDAGRVRKRPCGESQIVDSRIGREPGGFKTWGQSTGLVPFWTENGDFGRKLTFPSGHTVIFGAKNDKFVKKGDFSLRKCRMQKG